MAVRPIFIAQPVSPSGNRIGRCFHGAGDGFTRELASESLKVYLSDIRISPEFTQYVRHAPMLSKGSVTAKRETQLGSVLEERVDEESVPPKMSDERRRLVARVAASASFCRAPQLQEFFLYISERSLSNKTDQVTEQIIGTKVFKRRPGYSTGDDNIVRTYARQLRKRLEEYFSTAGAEEKLIVTVPKGGYALEFHLREVPSEAKPIFAEDLLPRDLHSSSSDLRPVESATREKGIQTGDPWFASWKIILPIAICVSLISVIAAYRLGQRTVHIDESTPALHAFWSGVLGQNRTVVVPDDTGLTIAVGLIQQEVTPEEYVDGQYRKTLGQKFPNLVNWDRPFAHRYTDLVDLLAVNRLARMPELNREPTTIRYARDLRPEELNDGNAILFGGSNANPWVTLFDRDLNFGIHFEPIERSFTIENRNPKADEAKSYPYAPYSTAQAYFGLVAVRPNFKNTGNIVLLEGVTNSGLQAAVDFCLDEHLVGELLKSVLNKNGTIRPFEVLVRTTAVGSTPTKVEVVGMRVH